MEYLVWFFKIMTYFNDKKVQPRYMCNQTILKFIIKTSSKWRQKLSFDIINRKIPIQPTLVRVVSHIYFHVSVRINTYTFTFLSGLTGLTFLGDLGRTKMLKRLSELGVLLYHQDPDGQAAIHRAVRNVSGKNCVHLLQTVLMTFVQKYRGLFMLSESDSDHEI